MKTAKKSFVNILIIVLFFTLFDLKFVDANDGFGVNYDSKHDLISCVVVQNVSDFNKNETYLYFDYSNEIGKRLGRPWTRVESSKCYEYSTNISDTSQFFVVKTDNLDFINYLDTTAKNDFDTISYGSKEFVNFYKKYSDDVTLYLNIEDEGVRPFKHTGLGQQVYIDQHKAIDLDIFKYSFGHGITWVDSTQNGERKLSEHFKLIHEFTSQGDTAGLMKKLYSTRDQIVNMLNEYSSEISSKYNQCLTGIKRVELHENLVLNEGFPSFESIGTFVLTTDDEFIKVERLYDYFNYECKRDVYQIHKKWLDVINIKGDEYYNIVQKINSIVEDYYNVYLSGKYHVNEYASTTRGMISINDEIIEIEEPEPDEENTELVIEDYEQADLDSDDITKIQNTKNNFNSVNNSGNFLFYLYISLPLLAIIIAFIIYKRRKI